jgi:hypothetical protein
MTREELLKRIEQVLWAVYSKEEEHPDPVAYRMSLVNDLLDEYERPTHKKINGVDGYLGPDIPVDPAPQPNHGGEDGTK